MKHRLPGDSSGIYANIEAQYFPIIALQFLFLRPQQKITGFNFELAHFEVIGYVTLWNHQRMQEGRWIEIAKRHRHFVLFDDAVPPQVAERTTILLVRVGVAYGA